MLNNTNGVHEVYCEQIDFNVLILELPIEELEDKLAYFAKDKGLVAKALYDDYLIATFIANINQIMHRISEDAISADLDHLKLREFIVAAILEKNSSLVYENIYINKNYILKLKGDKELELGEKILTANDKWNYTGEEDLPPEDSIVEVPPKDIVLKDIDSLEFTSKQKWWKRIGRYVNVKVFNKIDLPSLLNDRFFHSGVSFNTFVVTLCVEDFEELFQLLENMGIPARVAPPLLMKELYDLCHACNPFLTHENAQLFSDKSSKDPKCTSCKTDTKNAATGSTSMDQFANKVDKKKKTFANVPEEDLLNLATNMKVSLIGQDKSIESVVEAIQRASVGLKDPVKPIGSFLFAGSTGTGKSLTSKILADELIKDRDNLITIDCSEYSADHEYAKLIGAPNGYTGFEQGGILTNAVLEHPFSVVVFDEIEKASSKIYQLLLQVFEEGRLTDNKGVKVSFKDTVIILTSNVGVGEIKSIGKSIGFGNVSEITPAKKEKAIETALKKKFKPEFLNRLDEIVYFNDLSRDDYLKIIDIELFKLNDNLQRNNTKYKALDLSFDKKIRQFIYDVGINKEYGARPLKRAIEKQISTPLAVQLLKGKVSPTSVVKISTAKGEPTFKFTNKKLKPIKDILPTVDKEIVVLGTSDA